MIHVACRIKEKAETLTPVGFLVHGEHKPVARNDLVYVKIGKRAESRYNKRKRNFRNRRTDLFFAAGSADTVPDALNRERNGKQHARRTGESGTCRGYARRKVFLFLQGIEAKHGEKHEQRLRHSRIQKNRAGQQQPDEGCKACLFFTEQRPKREIQNACRRAGGERVDYLRGNKAVVSQQVEPAHKQRKHRKKHDKQAVFAG